VTSSNVKRAVIYARISRDSKQGSGLGVGKQVEDCRDLAARLGFEVVEPVRQDNDLTAFKGGSRSKRRPGYQDLLDDIRTGRADVVLAWHTDRLHRDMTELEEYITVCGEGRSGVPTNTVKGGDLDLSTSSGRMVARILGAVARGEVEHMIERQKSAHERIRNAGGYHGGPRPFGYRRDGLSIKNGGEGRLAQVPAEAEAIRKACADVLAGVGPHPIAKQWNGAGLLTTAGKPWNNVNVRLMLIRGLNAGLIEHGGGKSAQAQRDVVGTGNWEPIVGEDTWRAVRAVLTDPGRRTGPGPKHRHLLTGVLVCGVCGGRTFRTLPSKWGSLYQCASHGHRPAGEAGPKRWHLARKQEPLDDFIEQVVIERLSRPDVVAALNTRPEVDIPALDRRRTTINSELEEWARAPGITPRQLQIRNGPLLDELAEVERQISEGLRGDPLPEFAGKDPAKVWAELKETGNVERMRTIVRMLLRVRLLPVGRGGSRRGKRLVDGRVPFDLDTVEILPPAA
jgi:DNA invertase Pin-like site-specific DNA recombinase